jgi:hypothetical protein
MTGMLGAEALFFGRAHYQVRQGEQVQRPPGPEGETTTKGAGWVSRDQTGCEHFVGITSH